MNNLLIKIRFLKLLPLFAGIAITNYSYSKSEKHKKDFTEINYSKPKGTNYLNKDSILVFNIDKPGNISDISLSELGFKDIEYIPLETKKECLIGNIYKLYTGTDFYLVHNFGNILKFSSDGTFIAKIGKQGRGPREFQNAQSVSVNPENGNIFVLSAWENKIYIHSPDGKFIKTIPAPSNTTNLICLDNNILCYSRNQTGSVENSFDVIDYEGKFIKSFPNKYKYQMGKLQAGFMNEFFNFFQNRQLYVKEFHSDTIFIFRNLNFEPKIILNSGGKRLPPQIRNINYEGESKTKFKPYLYDFNLSAAGNYLLNIINYKGEFYRIVANEMNDSRQVRFSNGKLMNDIDGGPDVDFSSNTDLACKANENQIIRWINAIELKQYIASNEFKNSTPKYPEKKKALEKLANSLNENDNPVLMLVKLKE